MKVLISYPPFEEIDGIPLLGQNRQYQVFGRPTYIYPVVPASAATLLKENGYQVIWNDSIAEGWNYPQFLNFIREEEPDLIAFETKTPVVKRHWKIIKDIKELSRNGYKPKIVLMGDHVTALPEESFRNSPVDFIITGGDYDFLLLNLCNILKETLLKKKTGQPWTIDHGLSTNLEPGIWYRENEGKIKNSGPFKLNDHDLNSLPFIDRELTNWQLYAYENGNYKHLPGTYIMSGRDCWYGKCTFCSWTTIYPQFRVRKPENVLDEIGQLIDNYGIKEIMDDTGTFPTGGWVRKFCRGFIERGYHKKVVMDCNMRFGALTLDDYKLMKQAGFRLLLFGLESANPDTLNKVNKQLNVDEIILSCRLARQAGLYPHITIMFGYPWESYEDSLRTLKLGRYLLRKGYAYTAQATLVIPYPGTPLFKECEENGWLKTLDWNRYDMKEPIMKTPMSDEKIFEVIKNLYGISFHPEFIYRRLLSVRDLNDMGYLVRGAAKAVGHFFDFGKKRDKSKIPNNQIPNIK